jgi:hypothetical protein
MMEPGGGADEWEGTRASVSASLSFLECGTPLGQLSQQQHKGQAGGPRGRYRGRGAAKGDGMVLAWVSLI